MKLDKLKSYFETVKNYPKVIVINRCSRITNVEKMVEQHISTLEGNTGKPRFQPYYDRLMLVYNTLNEGNVSEFLRQSRYDK